MLDGEDAHHLGVLGPPGCTAAPHTPQEYTFCQWWVVFSSDALEEVEQGQAARFLLRFLRFSGHFRDHESTFWKVGVVPMP